MTADAGAEQTPSPRPSTGAGEGAGLSVTFADVEAAARTIAGAVAATPAVRAAALSQLAGADVVIKLENLQLAGSFKTRGAFNKLASLSAEQRRKGVIAASAGNHAQGVACHARQMHIPATIVMPKLTPFTKVARTEAYGARIVLEGSDLAAAERHARDLQREAGTTFVHAYDDPLIIAGQGTVALELLTTFPDLDALIVPIGGGGLIAGCAVAAKAMCPSCRLIGVEVEGYASMVRLLGGLPPEPGGETLAEGIAVKAPGALSAPVVRALVDDIVVVSEHAIERAMYLLLDQEKLVAEGAGAAALAALLGQRQRFAGRRVGLIVSGGNVDARILAAILMRGLVREGCLVRLSIEISDAPGTLARVAEAIAAGGGNIVEIRHLRLANHISVKRAELDAVVECRGRDVSGILSRLSSCGFPTRLIEDVEKHPNAAEGPGWAAEKQNSSP